MDVFGVDLGDQEQLRFIRGQLLRYDSITARRFDLKLSDWPYPLFHLPRFQITVEQKLHICHRLKDAPQKHLDVYADGFRESFPTEEEMLKPEPLSILDADFRAMPYSVDMIERMNSEITALQPRRAPARTFPTAQREHFMSQCVEVSGRI